MVLQCKTAELSDDVFFLDQTLDSNSYCIDCELPSGTFQCLEANLFQGWTDSIPCRTIFSNYLADVLVQVMSAYNSDDRKVKGWNRNKQIKKIGVHFSFDSI